MITDNYWDLLMDEFQAFLIPSWIFICLVRWDVKLVPEFAILTLLSPHLANCNVVLLFGSLSENSLSNRLTLMRRQFFSCGIKY